MNLDEGMELDRILAEADDEPGLSPEIVGAVVTPTVDAGSAQGIAPRGGEGRGNADWGGLMPGALPIFLSWTILQGFALYHLIMKQSAITDCVMIFTLVRAYQCWHVCTYIMCT